MLTSKFPSSDDSYSQLTRHLLNPGSPINYSLEYLLDNYGERAVPALLQALPVRPWYEQRLLLDALGKLGDLNAFEPVCALLYGESKSPRQLENSVVQTLRNLVYYCPDQKKATNVIIETMLRYEQCIAPLSAVLKSQKSKYAIKMCYKKLFRRNQGALQESAINVIGEENGLTEYRIKYLKKILFKLSDSELRENTIGFLKVLISRKRCERLCRKKGMSFDAFFRRPGDDCYDCCCVDKTNKRVLIQFEGSLLTGKAVSRKPEHPSSLNAPNSMRLIPAKQQNKNKPRP